MAIPTSRTKVSAQIILHSGQCTGCGLCVEVCNDNSLHIVDHKAAIHPDPFFGCIGCGHCMAVCPAEAIEIKGREVSKNDLFPLENSDKLGIYDYSKLHTLLQKRRSIREFKDRMVDDETILKILDAAKTAPMGLPPSDVHVLVLKGKEINRAFATDYCHHLEKMKWFVSSWFLALMKPFWGKANDELFHGFVKPLFHIYTSQIKQNKNLVNYDPPLSMYFYASAYADPADPIIAATYAMIAAESLGLGTCMLGGVHPLIQSGKSAKKFREKYKIKNKSREGLIVIFGYPAIKYNKGIQRTFASVTEI